MKAQQKVSIKRYFLYAKRKNSDNWSDWAQVNNLDRANWHVKNIREHGFLAKLVDKKTKEVLIIDGKKALS